jgi:hypothetical protein
MKTYLGGGGIAPHILNLGTGWRWVVNFRPLPLNSNGKSPPVPIGWEAGWAPEPVWTRWLRENFAAPAGTWTPDHPARNPALYQLSSPGL